MHFRWQRLPAHFLAAERRESRSRKTAGGKKAGPQQREIKMSLWLILFFATRVKKAGRIARPA